MANIVCDLDCSRLRERLTLSAVEAAKKEITRLLYGTWHKVSAADVLVLKIVKMPMDLLPHTLVELHCSPRSNVKIILDNLASESEVLYILNNVLKLKNLNINQIEIRNVNSQFPDAANTLIAKHFDALNLANIVTTIQPQLESSVVTQGIFAQTSVPTVGLTVDTQSAKLAGLRIN